MNTTVVVHISTFEICQLVNQPTETIVEIVEHGIVEVRGEDPDNWLFDESAVEVAKRAIRMRQELEINWPGVALALELLEEKQRLVTENTHLKQRLSRFLLDD